MKLSSRLRTWWTQITSPGRVSQELAWRGYALNSLALSLAIFALPFFLLNLAFWLHGKDDGMTALASFVAFFMYLGILWVSKYKSIPLAILLLSIFAIVLSYFLSFGWGVADITVGAMYVAAIMITSLLLQDRYFLFVIGALVLGYLAISSAELNGRFTPPFSTALSANRLTLSLILIMLSLFGYITARLIDRVLAAQVAEAARRQELESRTRIATQVQLSMLPAHAPRHNRYDIDGQSIPARDVGGDFYSYHQLAGDELAIVVGDVTGKGISAALLMAVTTGMIDSLVPGFTEPAGLLATLAVHLQKHGQRSGLNSACVVSFLQGYRLRVANAGCIEPLIRRADGRVEWLEVGGFPLGLAFPAGDIAWDQAETSLRPGDMVIFVTDGVIETKNRTSQLFSFKAFEAVIACGPDHSAEAMKLHILDRIEAYRGAQEQEDDVTVVIVRVKEDTADVT